MPLLSAELSCYWAVRESARSQHFTFKGRGSSSWLNWCSNTTAASTFAERGSFLTKSSKCSSVSNPRTKGKAQKEHDIYKRESSQKHLVYTISLRLSSRFEEWLPSALHPCVTWKKKTIEAIMPGQTKEKGTERNLNMFYGCILFLNSTQDF